MKLAFVESSLITKFGSFVFRVYAARQGKETVVVRTKHMNPKKPVLVRVHSECMTGDTFGSQSCDCGEQLARALKLIAKGGNGALVYLRQEGRGIGLFEKIKAYKLQEQGYDTFEANIRLGHRPDERNYRMAKQALADLGVKRIKLLTNSPLKVAEMKRLGIEVVERIPLVIASNKNNKRYLATKRDKFKNFLK